MATIRYKGINPIPEVHFKKQIDVSASDFDGSASSSISDSLKKKTSNGFYTNPWARGFLVQPVDTDGEVSCLSWEAYKANGYTVDDTLAQDVYLTVGQWSNERVIKVYSASAAGTGLYIGV